MTTPRLTQSKEWKVWMLTMTPPSTKSKEWKVLSTHPWHLVGKPRPRVLWTRFQFYQRKGFKGQE